MKREEFSKKVRAESSLDGAVFSALSYDAGTGKLTWLKTNREANSVNNKGYGRVKVRGRLLSAHRVAWFLHYGKWPDGIIDHINGKKTDNRIVNLRVVTNRENGMNRKLNYNSKSGAIGVTWAPRQKAWKVYIRREGENVHLGYFKDKSEACTVRKAAEADAGYSAGHGRIVDA